MAGCHYEVAAGMDWFYKAYPNQNRYIEAHWNEFVGQARSVLADMLTKSYPDDQKEVILDALLLDRTLPASQSRGLN